MFCSEGFSVKVDNDNSDLDLCDLRTRSPEELEEEIAEPPRNSQFSTLTSTMF